MLDTFQGKDLPKENQVKCPACNGHGYVRADQASQLGTPLSFARQDTAKFSEGSKMQTKWDSNKMLAIRRIDSLTKKLSKKLFL